MLRIVYKSKNRKMSKASGLLPSGHGTGPQGRIEKLRKIMTALIRHERLEGPWHQMDEARGYVELLIQRAQKHGNKHRETMELADFWILEKDLIPKLFEVLAPRYEKYQTAFTSLYMLPVEHPGINKMMGILELKGNAYPPVLPKHRDIRGNLVNVLVGEMRKDFYRQKYQKASAAVQNKDTTTTEETESATGESSGQSKGDSFESDVFHTEAEKPDKEVKDDGKAPELESKKTEAKEKTKESQKDEGTPV